MASLCAVLRQCQQKPQATTQVKIAESKSKLQEKLGDENAEAVDQLLRGLFKRK